MRDSNLFTLSAGKTMRRLRIVAIPLVDCVVLLLSTKPTRTLSANTSTSSQALPISVPVSQLWYVGLRAGSYFL